MGKAKRLRKNKMRVNKLKRFSKALKNLSKKLKIGSLSIHFLSTSIKNFGKFKSDPIDFDALKSIKEKENNMFMVHDNIVY